MSNAKNRLQELFHARGWRLDWSALLRHDQLGLSGGWRSTIDHVLPDGRRLVGAGEANKTTQADIAAIAAAFEGLDVEVQGDDDAIMVDAQAGDALIKLAAYVVMADASPASRSLWLQHHETDAGLSTLFDRWWDAGDEDVQSYGRGRGEKFQASVVEALIWRRFRDRVIMADAKDALVQIIDLLGRDARARDAGSDRPAEG